MEIFLTCVYIVQILSIVAVIFIERKDPVDTMAWVMILTFLPAVGVFLYFIFGRGLKTSRNKKLDVRKEAASSSLSRGLARDVDDILDITRHAKYEFNDPVAEEYLSLIRMNYTHSYGIYTQNNAVEIFTDAKTKYESLFNDIRGAKTYIHMIYFIISNNNAGRQLIEELAKKARQGVEVSVVYDDLGSFLTPQKLFKPLKKAGGEVHRFFPLSFGKLTNANYRNHHKIVVIDGKTAYTGGMNIGDEYMGLDKRKNPWRDTHMRLMGSSVLCLEAIFLSDLVYALNDKTAIEKYYNERYFPLQEAAGTTGIQVLNSCPDDRFESNKRAIVDMIYSAKKSICIQSPYLMPDKPVLEALQSAAASGVEVAVMLPGIPDKKMVYYVTVSYIEELLDFGVKVYIYNGFLHAKMIVIDDRLCTIGTTNMDIRSFSLHFEVNEYIFDSQIAEQCSDIFAQDIEQSYEMTREIYKKRGNFKILLEKVLRMFAPLM